MESTRLDRWLTAVRLYKQRTDAASACQGGKVRLNGRPVRPSSPVRVGDTIEARIGDRERIVEVVKIIEKRVGAPVAVECYVDHSPPPEPRAKFVPPPGRREQGAGRPTKRDRRMIDRFRGR
ncbi:MAG: RNA-binding S4 domain-containing protein [Solirubrobacterales bacterium]